MADSEIISGIETKNITHVNGIEGKNINRMGGSYGAGYIWCQNAYYYSQSYEGDHAGAVALQSSEYSMNLKRLLLSIWSNASSSFEMAPGMIAMWESLTPPDGWVLCNGSNGTPDLRDCFIKNTSSGNEGSGPVGDGTITLGGTVTHNNTHAHGTQYPDYEGRTWDLYKHGTLSNSHSHGLNSSIGWLPPYYALSFIMKAA